jgi:hypothetical protein
LGKSEGKSECATQKHGRGVSGTTFKGRPWVSPELVILPVGGRAESGRERVLERALRIEPKSPGGEEGKPSISRCRLEATASKEPAHALTLHTLVIAVITCSFARWAFGPIFLTDCALIYSRASMRATHAPAFPIGKDNVMARRSTACANCDRFRALHAVGQCHLPPQPAPWRL